MAEGFHLTTVVLLLIIFFFHWEKKNFFVMGKGNKQCKQLVVGEKMKTSVRGSLITLFSC